MQTIRAHNSILKLSSKESKVKSELAQRQKFLKNPHKFTKDLFSDGKSGDPSFDKDTADSYFKETYSDPDFNYEYRAHNDLPRPQLPKHKFINVFPDFLGFSKFIHKKSNKAAPGVNGIPYILYKNCTSIRKLLWKLLKFAWNNSVVPVSWKRAWIKLLSKSEDTSHPSLMRPISVLNVEGRIFFSIVQAHLSKFLTQNDYIKISIQKAFIRGIAGCIEHGAMVWEALRYAFEHQLQICISWLDLKNAYGSVRHSLVQFALDWYHVPKFIKEIFLRYYD